ncbi:BrnT family toxin [Devosia rhizoryzae]|uniref:BrnT family toxin n=1 Tax=Devosia rhizoryzae TaxID=2774137 RepID=A0ABX7C4L3_9HYPH|nr:BrnT family toxin [Devosia rhizoryzae]QQR39185.1 BrnT family toxin [Devosia rhizoryzae]
MIDWSRIAGFEWDAGNARKSVDKHHVSQGEAEQAFFNQPLLLVADQQHSQHEARVHALGHTDQNRLLHITFTLRQDGTRIRVISARDMNREERKDYEQGP